MPLYSVSESKEEVIISNDSPEYITQKQLENTIDNDNLQKLTLHNCAPLQAADSERRSPGFFRQIKAKEVKVTGDDQIEFAALVNLLCNENVNKITIQINSRLIDNESIAELLKDNHNLVELKILDYPDKSNIYSLTEKCSQYLQRNLDEKTRRESATQAGEPQASAAAASAAPASAADTTKKRPHAL